MKVVIYCGDPVRSANPSTEHIDALRAYARRRGWEIVLEVFEIGPSFCKRRDLTKALQAIRDGRAQAVLTPTLFDWSRSTKDLARSLKEIIGRKAEFYTLYDGQTIAGETGAAIVDFLFALQETEHHRRSLATNTGLGQARRKGSELGRPKLRGPRRDDIADRILDGQSVKDIATDLGVSRATVYNILKRPQTD